MHEAVRAQWGADYFLEGIRYSPDGAEFLESIGRMAPADMDLLGEDADAGASTTLDESFADLDGSRPAQVPALGADGARRERDALDPPAADGADADRSARCVPLAMQPEPHCLPRAVQAALARPWGDAARDCCCPARRSGGWLGVLKWFQAPVLPAGGSATSPVMMQLNPNTELLHWCKSGWWRRWQQPAQPALPYEEDDDDETEGLSALNN